MKKFSTTFGSYRVEVDKGGLAINFSYIKFNEIRDFTISELYVNSAGGFELEIRTANGRTYKISVDRSFFGIGKRDKDLRRLREFTDILLPKLMSGYLEVAMNEFENSGKFKIGAVIFRQEGISLISKSIYKASSPVIPYGYATLTSTIRYLGLFGGKGQADFLELTDTRTGKLYRISRSGLKQMNQGDIMKALNFFELINKHNNGTAR